MAETLSVVIPIYNEEQVIWEMYKRILKVLSKIDMEYEIILVDDGSIDRTLELAKEICSKDNSVRLISFSRNFGHQFAITAGMDWSSGEAIVVIDADLQDPPEIIPQMVEKWRSGYHVVYGVRDKRNGENWFKLFTAATFYRILKRITSIDIPVDTGDFRLIDRTVLDYFRPMRERARFVRGMISWVGFKQGEVKYTRNERYAGKTKYPFHKMVKFAIDGILSFSQTPLRIASIFGFISSFISFFFLLYGIIIKLFFPIYAVPGWTSIFTGILFLGGIQLICLGVLGEYIGRIYEETKNRPLYVVNEKVNFT